jgi:hypothetical protein
VTKVFPAIAIANQMQVTVSIRSENAKNGKLFTGCSVPYTSGEASSLHQSIKDLMDK